MDLNFLKEIWLILQVLIGYNLVFPLFLYGFYLLRKRRSLPNLVKEQEADYAVIVTAYEQTDSMHAVVSSILQLNYTNYLIYIVADKCDISGLQFDSDRVVLLRPEETLSSNTKSHFYAIRHFKRAHERLTIIDSDNLVDPGYLRALNPYFDLGFKAVQGVRAAKNLDTVYACLDAARDMYYHFYDGKMLFEAGASATLAGSGMAFTTDLYRDCLEQLEISGAGFDKVLQYEILKRGERIAFAEHAIVYDEKTSRSEQLVKQRARWINTWFRYFGFGFCLIAKGITRFNLNQALFGLVLLRPPLFIFLLLSLISMLLDLFLFPLQAYYWMGAFLLFFFGFFFSLIRSGADRRIYRSLWGIPKFVFFQLQSLGKSAKANELSVATTHYHDHKKN